MENEWTLSGTVFFFETEPLYWAISNLVEPPKDRIKFDVSMVIAFLDEHLAICSK